MTARLGRSPLLCPHDRCLFKLQDAAQLATARQRLSKARACLARSHGPNGERLRVLHGNFRPELATCANPQHQLFDEDAIKLQRTQTLGLVPIIHMRWPRMSAAGAARVMM